MIKKMITGMFVILLVLLVSCATTGKPMKETAVFYVETEVSGVLLVNRSNTGFFGNVNGDFYSNGKFSGSDNPRNGNPVTVNPNDRIRINVSNPIKGSEYIIAVQASTGNIFQADTVIVGSGDFREAGAFIYYSVSVLQFDLRNAVPDPESDFGAEPINNGTAVLINGYLGNKQVVNIPPTIRGLPVTQIRDGVFRNRNLTTVIIPDSVGSIGNFAFAENRQLTNLYIGSNVVYIGEGAFKDCRSLTNVVIPDSVTVIYGKAFEGCTGLTSVTIGNSVRTIGTEAFKGCTGLVNVKIPNSVTVIYQNAFYGCTGLTSIIIPDSVTGIGISAFMGCTRLTNVTIGNSVTVIGSYAFMDCTSITNVTIGSSVTNIGNDAFKACRRLTNIVIPDSVIQIGSFAFMESGLSNVTFGDSVRTIGQDAFRDCRLVNITIPASVTRIYDTAFYGNSNLSTVTFLSQTPPTLGSAVFNYTNANVRFEVPAASVNAYKSAWMERNLSNQIFPIWE